MGRGNRVQEPVKRRNHRKQESGGEKEEEDEVKESFKSPNLEAERRRRKKLHDQLMALRSHVPIITNMTKASIVEDAITYIKELEKKVENLMVKLHEMEDAPSEIDEEQMDEMINKHEHHETNDLKEEMKKLGIEDNVQLCKIGNNKFWLKIITEKREGIFTKFMEVMRFIGFEIIDISVTTSNGAILMSSSVQTLEGLLCGDDGDDSVDVEQIKRFLLEVIISNP